MSTDFLKSSLRYSLPSLDHPNCKLGLVRLQMMATEEYVSVGYYYRNGLNLTFTYLDGLQELFNHKNLYDTVWETLAQEEVNGDACGYFFILPSKEVDCLQYTHYYMNLG